MCYFFILSWDNDFVVRAWGHTGHFVSESYTQFVDSASLVPFGCNVDLKDWPVDVDLGLSRLWIPLAPDWRVYLQYTLSQYFAHNPQHATDHSFRSCYWCERILDCTTPRKWKNWSNETNLISLLFYVLATLKSGIWIQISVTQGYKLDDTN